MTARKSTTSVFVDSTSLIYLAEKDDLTKRTACATWLKALVRSEVLILNPQVLNETYWVLRRKPRFRVGADQARRFVQRFIRFARAPAHLSHMFDAWQIEEAYGVRYYDALLLASANAAGCTHFLSEDLNDGQRYGRVQAINPFRHAPEDVLGRASRN